MNEIIARLITRGGTAAEWSTANPILALNELGRETDTGFKKWGNGTDNWNTLPYDLSIPRVQVITTAITATLNVDLYDEIDITALASDVTLAVSGTPKDGQKIIFRYKDNGTQRNVSISSDFIALVSIGASTTTGKVSLAGARYSAARSKWEIIATVTEP